MAIASKAMIDKRAPLLPCVRGCIALSLRVVTSLSTRRVEHSLLRMRWDARGRSPRQHHPAESIVNRSHALANARNYIDSGSFLADLARRVACRTESQDDGSGPALRSYLSGEIAPA